MQAWIDGIGSKASAAAAAMRSVSLAAAGGLAAPGLSLGAAVAVPSSAGPAFRSPAGIATGPTQVTRNNYITVPITGLLKARDPFDVARRLQRVADDGFFDGRDER